MNESPREKNPREKRANISRVREQQVFFINTAIIFPTPSMSSNNHRERRPRARRSEDARLLSAGVRRSFFANNNSNANPAEDVLGLAPLMGRLRSALPSTHGGLFTAPLTREALRAERRAVTERQQQRLRRRR